MTKNISDIRIVALDRVRRDIEAVAQRLEYDASNSTNNLTRIDLASVVGIINMVMADIIESDTGVSEKVPF